MLASRYETHGGDMLRKGLLIILGLVILGGYGYACGVLFGPWGLIPGPVGGILFGVFCVGPVISGE